jgi:hypothetical protein
VVFTVGYVVWSLRGVSLLTSFLTTMPLWRTLDPLPVLEARARALARRRRREQRRSWWRFWEKRPISSPSDEHELDEVIG